MSATKSVKNSSRRPILAGHIGRTLYVVALAAMAPVLVLILYLGIEQRQASIEEVRHDTLNVAEAVFTLQRQFTVNTQQLLETIERLLRDIPPDDLQQRQHLLQEFLTTYHAYITFAVADKDGLLTVGAKTVPPNVPVTDRHYWKTGVKTGRFSAGEFVYSRTTKEPAFHFALPFKDGAGRFNGMLIATVTHSFPREYLGKLQLPAETAVSLIDNKGIRMHRYPASPLAPEGEPVEDHIWAKMQNSAPHGFFKDIAPDGQAKLYTYIHLHMDDDAPSYATLVLSMPQHVVDATADRALNRNLLWLLLAAVTALTLAHVLARLNLGLPAARLVNAARQLGTGDLTVRAQMGDLGGEVGLMARTFDSMAGNLLDRDRQRLDAEAALVASERKFRAVFENAVELLGLLTPEGRMLEANPAALKVAGVRLEAVLGKVFWDTPWWNDDPKKQELIRLAVATAAKGEVVHFETSHPGYDGNPMHVDFTIKAIADTDGRCMQLIAEGRDITERIAMELRLRHMALHDPLTNLANRTLLCDRIGQAIAWSRRRPEEGFAVLFIDLNRFKVINDSLGHSAGDIILQQVANRYQSVIREGDTLARYGSDEFVVLVRGTFSPREAIRLSRRLSGVLVQPIVINDQHIHVSAAVGIELNPPQDATPAELIRNANLAMLHAKMSKKCLAKVFTPRLLANIKAQQTMEQELPDALRNGQVHLAFQPIVDVAAGNALSGFEALCRWTHPVKGPISPMEFIHLAEETGLIVELGAWVLKTACASMAGWRQEVAGAEGVFLSVNVSPRQLSDSEFVPMVRETLQLHGILPGQLHLEITETALMESNPQTEDRLHELAALGVRLSIDDFGTGYSNMALMTKLPLSDLKIDLSIVLAMEKKHENLAVVKAILTMAQALGLDVVAEGVETSSQSGLLHELGCTLQQGYHHARPLPPEEALAMLKLAGLPTAA